MNLLKNTKLKFWGKDEWGPKHYNCRCALPVSSPDDEFKITKRMIYKTKFENFWRKRVTSKRVYIMIKYRLLILKKVLNLKNGVVLFDVIINERNNYQYNITSSNFLTEYEINHANTFMARVLGDRIQQEALKNDVAKANTILNEAKNILKCR